MKNFAIIGVAGFVAPKHLKAIKETGNNIVAALDKNDSVGILDSFDFNTDFFTEFERFDRHVEKLKRLGEDKKIHYVTICSPNYLHDSHVRFALRIGANAICEKPLVLNPWNLDALEELEKESNQKIYTVLQLRLHDTIKQLKNKIKEQNKEKHEVELTYITSRGNWYLRSWKGDIMKSGGVATNIGIHFFDMLMWVFGKVIKSEVYINKKRKMSGYLELERANVKWFLSLDKRDIPNNEKTTFRSIKIDGEELEFSKGFTELHTKAYQEILKGNGFTIQDARPSIELVHQIRNAKTIKPLIEKAHNKILS